MHILRSGSTTHVVWHHLRVSISSCRDLLAKNSLWPHLTPGDLPVTPDRQLHRDHQRCGEWPWSWNNWMVSVGLCETGSIFKVPHRLIIGRSRNWPDVTSPGWNFWDIHFIDTDDLKQPCKFHTDPTRTVAMAWLQKKMKEDQLSWPGDLTWPWAKNFTECPLWMFAKSQKVSAPYLQLFGNGTRNTWGGGGGLLKLSPTNNKVNGTHYAQRCIFFAS